MTKHEYLTSLKRSLRPVKRAEREKSLAYFGEQIDDRMEEGLSEEAAVAGLESIDAAATRILAEAGREGQKRRELRVWEIILLVLGFPLWFPLLLTVAAVVAVMYALVWVLIGVLFIVSGSLALCGLIGVFFLFSGTPFPVALAAFGAGLICAGIGTALFMPALFFVRAYAGAAPAMWRKLKFRKGGANTYE